MSIYVGDEAVYIEGRMLVISWKAPLATLYYDTARTEFTIRGQQLRLQLRRTLNVQNRRLLDMNTEYDGIPVAPKETLDPFLVQLLEQRREGTLSDIIRTIQWNQNEILRLPPTQNCVIQGCAGSGKSLVLLHRLAVLRYNCPSLSWSDMIVLTSGPLLDAHIEPVCRRLGLEEVRRFSVEEFYCFLMRRLAPDVHVSPVVESEKILDGRMLGELYSRKFQRNFIKAYHQYWKTAIARLESFHFFDICQTYTKLKCVPGLHTRVTYEAMEAMAKSVFQEFQNINSREEELRRQIRAQQARLAALESSFGSDIDLADWAGSGMPREIVEAFHSVLTKGRADSLQRQAELTEELRYDREKLQQAPRHLKHLRDVLRAWQAVNDGGYTAPEWILALRNGDEAVSDDPQVQEIIWKVNDLRRQRTELAECLEACGKGENRERKQLYARMDTLRRQIDAVLADAEEADRERYDHLQADICTLNDQIAMLEQEPARMEQRIREIRRALQGERVLQADVRSCLRALQEKPSWTEKSASFRGHLPRALISGCSAALERWQKAEAVWKEDCMGMDACRKEIAAEKHALVLLRRRRVTPTVLEDFRNSLAVLDSLSPTEIVRKTLFAAMGQVYEAHFCLYREENFRHRLYLKLLFCSLYNAPAVHTTPTLMVHADEAQDISIAEYALLRSVLGKECVFNLYGDVHQLTYTCKGIRDWTKLRRILAGSQNLRVMHLQENYRNSVQIVEYCNREFHVDAVPAGLPGAEVQELCLADAVRWILDFQEQHPAQSCAILYTRREEWRNRVELQLRRQLEQEADSGTVHGSRKSGHVKENGKEGRKEIEKRECAKKSARNSETPTNAAEITETAGAAGEEGRQAVWGTCDGQHVAVLTVEQAAGLEFGAAVVIRLYMTGDECYIACTRARDNLCVVRTLNWTEKADADRPPLEAIMVESSRNLQKDARSFMPEWEERLLPQDLDEALFLAVFEDGAFAADADASAEDGSENGVESGAEDDDEMFLPDAFSPEDVLETEVDEVRMDFSGGNAFDDSEEADDAEDSSDA